MAFLDHRGFVDDGSPNLNISGDVRVSGAVFINGSASLNPTYSLTQITYSYFLTINDNVVECTTGSFIVTLPTAIGITGKLYNIKNTGSGIITINTTLSQSIDGYVNGELALTQYECLSVVSNNTKWLIM
jgi:hypothetical protein